MTSSIKYLKVQAKIISALFLREMITHFGRHNLGFLWMFLEPMMFSIGVAILWSIVGAGKGIISPAGFALTGYSSIVLWRNCVGRVSITLSANKGLLFHRNITVFDLAVTRALFEFSASSVSFFILTIAFALLNINKFPQDPLEVIGGWLLLGWFSIAAGLIALYLDHKSELFQRIWHVAMYLTLPLTGAFTMVSWLPRSSQDFLLMSPMVNAVEMIREGFYGEQVHAMYSISYVITVNLILSLVSLALLGQVKRLITSE